MQRRYWTLDEDQALRLIVQSMDQINWTLVSHRMMAVIHISPRNAKQCRQRWINKLSRSSSESLPWSDLEDKIILQQYLINHNLQKNKWIHISQKLQSNLKTCTGSKVRTPNEIKNRFYSVIRKGIRRINNQLGKPVMPEDIRLLRPSATSKMLQNMEKDAYKEYIEIIYNMACDFPQLNSFSRQASKQNLQAILASVMQISKKQQKERKQKLASFQGNVKRRKSSLSTNEQQKGVIKSTGVKQEDNLNMGNDMISIYIKDCVEQSLSLQFEEIDFGI